MQQSECTWEHFPPRGLQISARPADTLTLALWDPKKTIQPRPPVVWPSELWVNKWVLLKVDKFVVICHTARDKCVICMSRQIGLLAGWWNKQTSSKCLFSISMILWLYLVSCVQYHTFYFAGHRNMIRPQCASLCWPEMNDATPNWVSAGARFSFVNAEVSFACCPVQWNHPDKLIFSSTVTHSLEFFLFTGRRSKIKKYIACY